VGEAPGMPQHLSNVASNFIPAEGNCDNFVQVSKATMKSITDLIVSPKLIANQFFGVRKS